MRITLWLLLTGLLGAPALVAQDIELRFQKSRDGDQKVYWSIEGKSDLPRGTVLIIELWYQQRRLLQKRLLMRYAGRFRYRYGPLRGIASGNYTWKVHYYHKLQRWNVQEQLANVGDFSEELEMYIGSHHERRQELQQHREFYRAFLGELKTFVGKLQAQSEELLASKVAPDAVQQWQSQMDTALRNLRSKCEAKHEHHALVTHFADVFEGIHQILGAVDLLVRARVEQLFAHYQLPLPPRHRQLRRTNFDFDVHTSRIRKQIQELHLRLAPPQTWDVEELHQDLQYFNKMFQGIVYIQLEMQKKFDARIWQQTIDIWEKEFVDFETKSTGYRQSPLLKRYPSLVGDLQYLVQNCRRLLWSFTVLLYKRHGLAIPREAREVKAKPQQVVAELNERFAQVYRIVSDQRQQQALAKKTAWEQVLVAVSTLEALAKKLAQGAKAKDREAFATWQQQWQRELAQARPQDAWRVHFPGFAADIDKICDLMQTVQNFYSKIHDHQLDADDLETAVTIRRCEQGVRELLEKLQRKVDKEAK